MPALWAERRAPPTARRCQPGRMRDNTRCQTIPSAAKTMKDAGTPPTAPKPKKSQSSDVADPPTIMLARRGKAMS